jgi:RNA polymerase sigma-70 factor (ECF subfamily)
LGVTAARVSFEDWYSAERPRLLVTLLSISGCVDLAREATDEAFARALASWERVAAMSSPTGWVHRVGLNVLRRQLRRRALERRTLGLLVRREPEASAGWEVWELVRQLPLRQRTAVVLRYVADLSEVEIAGVMGVRRGTVASTLHDAHRRLGELLRDADPIPGGLT